MDFNFTDELTTKDAIILFFYENNNEFGKIADNLDKKTGQSVFKSLNSTKFKGQEGQIFVINSPFGVGYSKLF